MVVRSDETETVSKTLLPSAFIALTKQSEGGEVSGYCIYGGGYGHGIGMSQNGAKNMALAGMDAEEILAFFYEQSEMEQLY